MLMELLVATFGKVLHSISVSYVQSKKQSVESSQPFWLLSLFEFCLRPLFFFVTLVYRFNLQLPQKIQC